MAKLADLVVNLTLETASLQAGTAKAQRDIARLTSDIGGSFRTLANVVGVSLGAISAASLVKFVTNLAESEDQIGKLSQKIGISVQDLSTLQHALKLSDVPMENFAVGVGLLSKALAGMADEQENKGAAAALQALGIKARDASGNLRPVIDVLLDIATRFQGFQDGVGKTNLALQLFGRSGKELIPFLNEGAAGIRKMQDEARAMGLEISGNTAQSAQNFNDSLRRIEDRAIGVSRQFLEGLVPSLDVVAKAFNNATGASDGFWKTLGSKTGLTIGGLILGIGRVGLEIERTRAKDIVDKARIDADIANLDRLYEELRKGAGLANNLPLDLTLAVSHGAPKVQPPNLPDAAAIAAAKKYADELARANQTVTEIISKATGDLDPFSKINQDYADTIDKLAGIWAKYPEIRAHIEDAVLATVQDRDKKIAEEEQKNIQDILDAANVAIAEFQKTARKEIYNAPVLSPIVTAPTIKPKLDATGFYADFVRKLSDQGKTVQDELDKIFRADSLKHSIDELILRTGTAADGAKVFFRQYAEYAKDTALVVHDAFARVFSALEDQLTNLLANFKFDAASLFQTIRESIARAVVQKFILGPIASALGLAKADGSEKNPFHVIVDNGGIPGIFGEPNPGGSGSDSGDQSTGMLGNLQSSMGKIFSAIGSFFAKIGSALVSAVKFIGSAIGSLFGGFKADGGDLIPGKFYMVGERGPELFAPGRNFGAVIPNHFLASSRPSANITNNFYLTPTRSDAFGYSESQLANATFMGQTRAMARA